MRWRLVDLAQWVWEEFRISISIYTLSRQLRGLGDRKLLARLRHHAQASGAIENFKKDVPAATVAPGAHAVLLMDRVGWHLSHHLVVPPNITVMPLSPKCSELNPVKNVWQFMRDNWLSNSIFQSYDAILDHCCEAWNKLIDQPWRIMSIGMRDWVHGF